MHGSMGRAEVPVHLVRAGSAWHREPLVVGGHERSRRAGRSRRPPRLPADNHDLLRVVERIPVPVVRGCPRNDSYQEIHFLAVASPPSDGQVAGATHPTSCSAGVAPYVPGLRRRLVRLTRARSRGWADAASLRRRPSCGLAGVARLPSSSVEVRRQAAAPVRARPWVEWVGPGRRGVAAGEPAATWPCRAVGRAGCLGR